MPAQQQIERARAPVPRLGRRDREDFSSQPCFFEPARNGTLEHPRPAWTETPAGDDEHAAPPGVRFAVDERGESAMRFDLSLSVEIEAGLDRVEATLQPFGIGPVDPRELVEGRGLNRPPALPLFCQYGLRGARRRSSSCTAPAQRRHAPHGFAPYQPVGRGRSRVICLRHQQPSGRRQQE